MLIVTGVFICPPQPVMGLGEASQHFLFGCIRFAHFAATVGAVGVLGRA